MKKNVWFVDSKILANLLNFFKSKNLRKCKKKKIEVEIVKTHSVQKIIYKAKLTKIPLKTL